MDNILLNKFCVAANINWLQYKIIELFQRFGETEICFRELFDLIKFGISNDIYNAVPIYSNGAETIDIAPALQKNFDNLFKKLPIYQQKIIKYSLVGDYDKVYIILEKIY